MLYCLLNFHFQIESAEQYKGHHVIVLCSRSQMPRTCRCQTFLPGRGMFDLLFDLNLGCFNLVAQRTNDRFIDGFVKHCSANLWRCYSARPCSEISKHLFWLIADIFCDAAFARPRESLNVNVTCGSTCQRSEKRYSDANGLRT